LTVFRNACALTSIQRAALLGMAKQAEHARAGGSRARALGTGTSKRPAATGRHQRVEDGLQDDHVAELQRHLRQRLQKRLSSCLGALEHRRLLDLRHAVGDVRQQAVGDREPSVPFLSVLDLLRQLWRDRVTLSLMLLYLILNPGLFSWYPQRLLAQDIRQTTSSLHLRLSNCASLLFLHERILLPDCFILSL